MSKIILVRHGETEWNRDRRWQGWGDSKLTEKGEEQARENAKVLALENVSRIYASPLKRERETLRCIEEVFRVPVKFDDRLKEISMGDWEGVSVEGVRHNSVAAYTRWNQDKEHRGAPNGESYADVRNRLESFLLREKIVVEKGINEYHQFDERPEYTRSNNDGLAIVSHGVAIKILLEIFNGIHSASNDRRGIPNNVVHVVQVNCGSLRIAHYVNGMGPQQGVFLKTREATSNETRD